MTTEIKPKKIYAGIGARKTPQEVLNFMKNIACFLEKRNYTLRSGGAKGADLAFQSGVEDKENYKIFNANSMIYDKDQIWSLDVAERFALKNSNFKNWNSYIKKLFSRNMMIILGENGEVPASFVICWTPFEEYANAAGGTPHGIRCALEHNIPVCNLFLAKDRDNLKKLIKDNK